MRTIKSIISSILLIGAATYVNAYSQDYARHLELNFLFYEAQRSGKLPETNRIPWRGDSGLTHGSDVGYDLTGGYYDAGDNVKFNFPQAFTMTVMAWSAIDFADGYETSKQMKYAKEAIKWGTDYLMKCHPEEDKFFIQVGDGDIDHKYWKPVEEIDYEMPSFMLSSQKGGSEVSAETAAALAAASILFKEEDPEYSKQLLDQAIEWFTFANTYRKDYHVSIPKVTSYYKSWGGYNDELGWGAAWLYRATNDESYLKIATSQASKAVLGYTAMDWDDKNPALVVLAYQLTKDESLGKRIDNWITKCVDRGTYTPGGLYWNDLSEWGSNRRSSALAANFAFYAKTLDKSNPIREKVVKFGKSQADYIQGNNPKKIDFVVGADETSPRSVHHRSASGTECCECEPAVNKHILYGALAGGPGPNDNYEDLRTDYVMNEVALDYNVGYCSLLAFLIGEGLNVKDPESTWEFAYKSQIDDDDEPSVDPPVCWAIVLGYECCKNSSSPIYTDSDGEWNVENGQWCGIVKSSSVVEKCWSEALGYKCCSKGIDVTFVDDDGKWGVEDSNWCGII